MNLKKLLKKEAVSSLLSHLLNDKQRPAALLDANDQLVLGKTTALRDVKVPVEVNGKLIAWLCGDESVRHIAGIVQHLAELEVEKKTLAREVLSGYKELNLFYNLSQKMKDCIDFEAVAKLFLDEVYKLVPCEQCCILLHDKKSGYLEVAAAKGKDADEVIHITPGQGIAGSVFQNNYAELINDVEDDPRYAPIHGGARALICVPLVVDEQAIGLMKIRANPSKTFAAQDLKLARSVAASACSAMENVSLQNRRIEQDRVKNYLARYVSPHVMEGIMASGEDDPLRPQRKYVSVLFSDIRNFTNMCEALKPEEMAGHLEVYFGNMVDVIFEKGGTLDKFVGDMILTFFNAPRALGEHERKSVETAILMQQRIKNIEDEWVRKNFSVGMGVACGHSVVGNIGPASHCDYTVIGDTVNIGSRLQSMADGGQILVSSDVYEITKGDFNYQHKGKVPLKGKSNHVNVFEVLY